MMRTLSGDGLGEGGNRSLQAEDIKSRAHAMRLIMECADTLPSLAGIDKMQDAVKRRQQRITVSFEAAKLNPLHFLETSTTSDSIGRKSKLRSSNAAATKTNVATAKSPTAAVIPVATDFKKPAAAAAAVATPSTAVTPSSSSSPNRSVSSSTLPKIAETSNLTVQKDGVLERNSAKGGKPTLKLGTLARVLRDVLDQMAAGGVGDDDKRDMKKSTKLLRKLKADTRHIGREFVYGSLKIWGVAEVLAAMVKCTTYPKEEWGFAAMWTSLETLVPIWLECCFPYALKGPDALEASAQLTLLVAAMPNKKELQDLMASLSQGVNVPLRKVKRLGTIARSLRTLPSGASSSSSASSSSASSPSNNVWASSADHLSVELLETSSDLFAVELTRVTLHFLRHLPVDRLVRSDFQISEAESHKAKNMVDLPAMFVLRQRTQRLSRWTASAIVGERDFKRRVKVFAKLVAICARLVELRNLHDAVAMVTGLWNPAVSRLKQTLAATGDTVLSVLDKVTNLIRPPFKNMRAKLALWASEEGVAFLPPLEVLIQDITKLDEVEKDRHPHPHDTSETPEKILGNVWKMHLIGTWVDSYMNGFRDRTFDFESVEPDKKAAAVGAFVKILPDVFEDDVLFKIALTLETSVVNL